MAKLSFSGKQIERPEIQLEYSGITQLPFIIYTMLKFRRKTVRLKLMCGEYCLGEQICIIKPKYRIKTVK